MIDRRNKKYWFERLENKLRQKWDMCGETIFQNNILKITPKQPHKCYLIKSFNQQTFSVVLFVLFN